MKNAILSQTHDALAVDISTPKHPGAVLTIAPSDWQRLLDASNGGRWSAVISGGKGKYKAKTVCAAYRDGKRIQAHRVLFPDCQAVLFQDGNPLNLLPDNTTPGRLSDCRKGNAHVDSQTGIKGISVSGDKFRLDIRYRRKTYYIGTFSDVEEAETVKADLEDCLAGLDAGEAIDFLQNIRK